MVPKSSNTVDKFIVDRRRKHRNSDVDRAVRKTREALSQRAGDTNFNREMLQMHAHAILFGAPAIPLFCGFLALGGFLAEFGSALTHWAILCVLGYVPLYLMARHTAQLDHNRIHPERTSRRFLFGHAIAGLGWAGLTLLPFDGIASAYIFKATILLVALAATAVSAVSLKGAVVAGFAFPVCLFAAGMILTPTPSYAVMAALLALSLPYFAALVHHRSQAALSLLSARSEHDMLVAELETAKAMSDEARRRAEEANLAKSRFLASMSHELRTPLNAILGFSEVMSGEILGPMQNASYRDYANDIHESGRHLLALINEILDLSRIEAGRYQLNEEPLQLGAIVEDCCRMVELKARSKGITVHQELETTLFPLYADERAVRQIVLNLLSNAVKFAPSNGSIRARAGWTAGGGQYIAIRDNGPGIPEDEIPVVLSAFGQGSVAIKTAEQGTGLGLPIVQGLVSLHGGTFELKSRLREGTEAIAIFPRSRVMEELPALSTGASPVRKVAN